MNFYKMLGINPDSNIMDICYAYRNKCLRNPRKTFYYTMALLILTNKIKRFFYDASLNHYNVLDFNDKIKTYEKFEDIDEFELIPFIEWLNDFKDFFYDTKYFVNNSNYQIYIEKWYDDVERILESLKELISSFYLA